ncbi:MAG TPA: hypothetical protein VFO63_09305 [Blastocatellia bacterium]|nr:hypothetical protein [Blastocatellia bacterium]
MLPEHELLVCCARTYLDSKSAARIGALVQQGIDWDYLIRAATHHSLLPLLHSHLSATVFPTPSLVGLTRLALVDKIAPHS